MAKETVTIELPGGENIKVPAWASQATQELLLAEMKKSNLFSKAMKDMLNRMAMKMGVSLGAVVNSNKKLSNEMDKVNKTIKKTADVADMSRKKAAENLRKHLGKSFVKGFGDIGKALQDPSKGLGSAISDLGDNVSGASLASNLLGQSLGGTSTKLGKLSKVIGGAATAVVGLGLTFAGAAISIAEEFDKALSPLNSIGLGIHGSLVDLRMGAAFAGLNLEEMGKIAANQQPAFRVLGSNISEGAQRFGVLSRELKQNARQFGQFGLNNQEFNEVLAEEIELLRMRGVVDEQAQNKHLASLNKVIAEQTAMAELTATDRKDRLAARQEVLANAKNALYLSKQTGDAGENLGKLAAATTKLGPMGNKIREEVMTHLRTGLPVSGEMMAILGPGLNDVVSLFKDAKNMSADEFSNLDIESKLQDTIGNISMDDNTLDILSSTGGPLSEMATAAIEAKVGLQGLKVEQGEAQAAMDKYKEIAESGGLVFLSMSEAAKDLAEIADATKIKLAAETIGPEADFREVGEGVVTALDYFGDKVVEFNSFFDKYLGITVDEALDRLVEWGGTVNTQVAQLFEQANQIDPQTGQTRPPSALPQSITPGSAQEYEYAAGVDLSNIYGTPEVEKPEPAKPIKKEPTVVAAIPQLSEDEQQKYFDKYQESIKIYNDIQAQFKAMPKMDSFETIGEGTNQFEIEAYSDPELQKKWEDLVGQNQAADENLTEIKNKYAKDMYGVAPANTNDYSNENRSEMLNNSESVIEALLGAGKSKSSLLSRDRRNYTRLDDTNYLDPMKLNHVFDQTLEKQLGNRTIVAPARETGGPVSQGKRYIVGESGPELFTPDTNGNISSSVPSSDEVAYMPGDYFEKNIFGVSQQMIDIAMSEMIMWQMNRMQDAYQEQFPELYNNMESGDYNSIISSNDFLSMPKADQNESITILVEQGLKKMDDAIKVMNKANTDQSSLEAANKAYADVKDNPLLGMSQEQGEKLLHAMLENNRLLRKQTNTIETSM